MRTEAVANPDLLRRWEMLTNDVGRPGSNGTEQPLTPVDPTLAGFDPLVQQLHRHSFQPEITTEPHGAVVALGMR